MITMTRDKLVSMWISELEVEGEQKRKLIQMLSSLDETELMRFFLIADNDHGMSCARVSQRYGVKIGFVKSQIRKARELIRKMPALFN